MEARRAPKRFTSLVVLSAEGNICNILTDALHIAITFASTAYRSFAHRILSTQASSYGLLDPGYRSGQAGNFSSAGLDLKQALHKTSSSKTCCHLHPGLSTAPATSTLAVLEDATFLLQLLKVLCSQGPKRKNTNAQRTVPQAATLDSSPTKESSKVG